MEHSTVCDLNFNTIAVKKIAMQLSLLTCKGRQLLSRIQTAPKNRNSLLLTTAIGRMMAARLIQVAILPVIRPILMEGCFVIRFV